MEFKILGALEVLDGRLSRTPTAPKIRQVLATLLIRANHFVGVEALIDEVWGEHPPVRAITTIQTYIHHIRKEFLKAAGGSPVERLVTEPHGYSLQVPEEHIDAAVFTRRAQRGSGLLDRNHPAEAAEALRGALALWRGAVASGVPKGGLLQAYAVHLEELKVQTSELWIEAEIRLGRHRQIIPDLRALTASYPLNESLHGYLIAALNRAGRRAEALEVYQRFRKLLDTELGLEPSLELRQLQHAVLAESA